MTEKIPEGRNKLQRMREQVREELEHIPRGNRDQNILRSVYQSMRMHSLGKYAKTKLTKEEVLRKSIEIMKKDDPKFEPNYDRRYFHI